MEISLPFFVEYLLILTDPGLQRSGTLLHWFVVVVLPILEDLIATISYQAFYNKAPAVINSLFTKQSPLRNHRDGLKLYVQRPRSDFLRSSFSHRASLLWNDLPMYLKSKPNVVSFKSALKAKSDILDKITFDGLQGINKDIVNYIY